MLGSVICIAACGRDSDNLPTPAEIGAGQQASAPALDAGDLEPGIGKRPVVAETLAYAEVDSQLVKGHFVFPEDMIDSLPAIILIHEWWGLDDRVRALADRIAGQGFVVLAVDLYAGQTATVSTGARLLMLKVVEHPESARENLHQAYDWVLATTGASQVGVVGYGFGGGWALNTAIDLPDKLNAAVMFYGQVIEEKEALAAVTTPILGFFGASDSSITAASVGRFEAALEKLGKVYEIELYPNAKSGFASPENRNYDKDLALKAWDRAIVFLHQHLTNNQK